MGVTVDHIGQLTQHRLLVVALVAIGALLLGLLGSLLIARWLRRQTLGMAPRELARLFTYYDAVLASVHEGMVLLDKEGRIVSVNVEGRRLLGLGDDAVGRTPAGAGLRAELAALLADSGDLTDELALTDDRVLLISRRPVRVRTELVGAVVTLRDHTELRSLTGELDRVQSFSDALRAQAHESANRLHTVISLIELGETDHALTFAVAELQSAQRLADRVLEGVGNPAVAALLLAKSAQAIERGIELTVAKGSYLPPDAAPDTELVTIVGNLVDNAFDVLRTPPDGASRPRPDRRLAVRAEGWPVQPRRRCRDRAGHRDDHRHRQRTGIDARAGDRGLRPRLVDQVRARARGRPRPGTGAGCAGGRPVRRHRDRPARGRGPVRRPVAVSGDRESIGTVAVGAAGTATAGGACGDRMTDVIRVLVVEDEPIAARAHQAYVERVPGFAVVDVAHTRMAAERVLAAGGVDLVLLDLHLPDGHGLDLFRRVRAAGSTVDVMVVSSSRDGDVVRAAVAQGAVQYVIKPFAFATLRERLVAYRNTGARSAAGRTSTRPRWIGRSACCVRSRARICRRA